MDERLDDIINSEIMDIETSMNILINAVQSKYDEFSDIDKYLIGKSLSTFLSLLLLFVLGVVGVAITPAIWLLPLVLGILATLSFFGFICLYSSMIQISSMSSKTLI